VLATGPHGRILTGQRAWTADHTMLVAPYVQIGDASDVFHVMTSSLKLGNAVNVRDDIHSTQDLPTGECALPPIDCGGPVIRALPGETVGPLPPGKYGRVSLLNGSTLVLEPGTFEFCDLRLGRSAVILPEGELTLAVEGSVVFGSGSTLTAAPGAPLPIVYCAGSTVRISQGASIEAALIAPDASLTLGRDSHVMGCFCVERAKSDKHITLSVPEP
jgi:hypothetical protein